MGRFNISYRDNLACFSAATALWERSNKKYKLSNEITLLKSHKEKKIEGLRQEYANNLIEIEESLKRKQKNIAKDLKELEEERTLKTNKLKKSQQEKIDGYIEKLNTVKLH